MYLTIPKVTLSNETIYNTFYNTNELLSEWMMPIKVLEAFGVFGEVF